MAIRLTSTAQALVDNGLKILVHGPAGAGKTSLCATTPGSPVIISAEAGLLSLRHHDIPVIQVTTLDDVHEAYRFITESQDAAHFDWVCLDSITEIAEVCLDAAKKSNKDPRAAYGVLQEQMGGLIRAFRDIPQRNVFMSCKQVMQDDQTTGAKLYFPSMPGAKLGQGLGYFFDEVFALRVDKGPDGQVARWLQTGRDFQYEAKDRSGALEMFEAPNLSVIAQKIHAAPGVKTGGAADSAPTTN